MEAERDDLARGTYGLARAEEERDPLTAPVVHLGPQRHHGIGLRIGRHARFRAVALVLPADHVLYVNRPQCLEHLLLFVPQVLSTKRHRRLHGHERHHLEQVGDNHVPVGAGRVVERGPRPQLNGFYSGLNPVMPQGAALSALRGIQYFGDRGIDLGLLCLLIWALAGLGFLGATVFRDARLHGSAR